MSGLVVGGIEPRKGLFADSFQIEETSTACTIFSIWNEFGSPFRCMLQRYTKKLGNVSKRLENGYRLGL